jgi:hypothetical protein
MAQGVINVDPWWNSAIEEQAFCRVYRFGQDKETSLLRLFVLGTVDEKIHKMQERKKKLIDAIMDPNAKKDLTIEELLSLFGDVKEDANGNYFVCTQDDRDRPDVEDYEECGLTRWDDIRGRR